MARPAAAVEGELQATSCSEPPDAITTLAIMHTSTRRRIGIGTAAALLVVGLGSTLAACTVIEQIVPQATPTRTEPSPEPDTEPVFSADGSAAENLPFFVRTLQQFAAGEGPIEGQPVVDALAAAGFEKSAMQVSFDHTTIGLPVDNLFVSVRIGADCLVGQLVPEGREYTAMSAPAVGPDENICIIGETRPIDW